MTIEVGAMMAAGVIALVAGFILVWSRFCATSGAGRIILLGPVFEAVAIAMFAAEHFTAASDLMPIVPHWLPARLFWTYFFGAALLAAAISFITWRCVRWSVLLLALFFLIIVATIDLPNLPQQIHAHNRFFWILTVRETSFAGGAMVLAGSMWQIRNSAGTALIRIGRAIVAAVMIFYAIQHFFHPHNVPGVPLEKLIPAWMPAPTLLSYFIGIVLLFAGIGLFFRPTIRIAAAGAGIVLLLLIVFFYLPILLMEIHTPLAIEGINYVGDTLLFAGTVLLAGFGADWPALQKTAAPPQ